MKNISMKQLDYREEEIADALISLGMNRHVAKTLSYLQNICSCGADESYMLELRKKIAETTEKELIREALRARKFSGISTLFQGMNLIDFALRVNKQYEKEQYSEK